MNISAFQKKAQEKKGKIKMTGYVGYSMSNNAVDAYNAGEMPFSKWTKTAILQQVTEIYGKTLAQAVSGWSLPKLKGVFLYKSSWHHTSKMYNRTDFYSVRQDLNTTEDELWDEKAEKEFVFNPFNVSPPPARWDELDKRNGMWTDKEKIVGRFFPTDFPNPDFSKKEISDYEDDKLHAAILTIVPSGHGVKLPEGDFRVSKAGNLIKKTFAWNGREEWTCIRRKSK